MVSDICVIQDVDHSVTYTLRVGDEVPQTDHWLITKVSRHAIELHRGQDLVKIAYQGRPESSEEAIEEDDVEEGSLEYFQKLLEKKRAEYQADWETAKEKREQKKLIICDADEQDCPIEDE